MSNPNAPIYRGTKQLKAWPMSKAQYCDYRGWSIPENEDPQEAGYLVEYLDGGKANDARHEGYISWSPADVFEKAYKPCGSHVDRMQIELNELTERTDKLAEFIARNPIFGKLDEPEQNLMQMQLNAMKQYRFVLAQRVKAAS